MNTKNELDFLIINRNLKNVTNNLIMDLKSHENVGIVGAVDAGSRDEEISKHTVVRDDSYEAKAYGLRINRGYNLGLNWWIKHSNTNSNWVCLLPNDSIIENMEIVKLLGEVDNYEKCQAIVPISPLSAYSKYLIDKNIFLNWHFAEGPIILKRSLVEYFFKQKNLVFDNDNFRGYLSFIYLAIEIYANNLCMVGSNLISFSENEDFLINNFNLIETESIDENKNLLIKEGLLILGKKYGLESRLGLELIGRLLFEEFKKVNPDIDIPTIF